MREKKLYYRYDSKELRLQAWRRNRASYNIWRSDEGRKWVAMKRKSQSNLCFICLDKLGDQVHVDHIFPLYLGGTNSYTNLSITHPDCNMDKGAKVTMTYKEACRRRNLLNTISIAHRINLKTANDPNYKVSKKQQKRLKKAGAYLHLVE